MRPIDKWREEHGPTPCSGQHRMFFPGDGKPGFDRQAVLFGQEARNICATCPAIVPCSESAILKIDGHRYVEPGIWAGRDQVERCKALGIPPVPGTGAKYAARLAARTRAQ